MVATRLVIDGMEDLRRGLRRIGPKMGKELGKVNKEVASEVVRWSERRQQQLQGRWPSYGASRIMKVAASANQRAVIATIRPAAAEYGTARHPVFGRWMAQGGFRRQVWPLPDPDGHLVGPTVADREQEIVDLYLDGVGGLVRRIVGE